MKLKKQVWTDYPFLELGDLMNVPAPERVVELISYDQDKYVKIKFEETILEVKSGYLYMKSERFGSFSPIPSEWLDELPIT